MKQSKLRKVFRLMLCLLLCTALTAPMHTLAAAKASIKLSASKLALTVGDSGRITAAVTGKSQKITWKSSNKSVATVKNGVITAKKPGKATISAKANGKTKKCVVTVKKDLGYVKVYKEYLAKRKVSWNNSSYMVNASEFKFALAYIDNNDVPELIIYNGMQTPHMAGYGMIYTCQNKKLVYVGSLDYNNTLYYYKKKGTFLDRYEGSGYSVDNYYQLKSGKTYQKLQRLEDVFYKYTGNPHYEYYSFSSGQSKLTKARFNSSLKKLVGSTKKTAVKLYSNNSVNRNKYIK